MPRTPVATGTRERGAAIERAAHDHLRDAGLTDVATNAGYRVGEIDLVMLDPGARDASTAARSTPTLVFVEVRYRRGSTFGGGAGSIDAGKRRRIVRAAQTFLATHRDYTNAACRFDVIDASGDPAAPELRWIKDAFRADDM